MEQWRERQCRVTTLIRRVCRAGAGAVWRLSQFAKYADTIRYRPTDISRQYVWAYRQSRVLTSLLIKAPYRSNSAIETVLQEGVRDTLCVGVNVPPINFTLSLYLLDLT